jgi:hypothetical protein
MRQQCLGCQPAIGLAVSYRHPHRVSGFRYVQPNINFAMLVHGNPAR